MDEFKEQTRPSTARKPSVKRDEEKRAALHAFGGGLKVLHIPSAALAGLPFTRQLTKAKAEPAKLSFRSRRSAPGATSNASSHSSARRRGTPAVDQGSGCIRKRRLKRFGADRLHETDCGLGDRLRISAPSQSPRQCRQGRARMALPDRH